MEVKHLSFSYGNEPVIKDLSFSLPAGRHIAVMGGSGSGKTTLLRLLLGFMEPESGSIERGGDEKTPAVVFQEDRLLPWYTALKNVRTVSSVPGEAESILADMELSDSMDKLPKELSGGMQRRVAIARALAFGGKPLLLDEPFKGLDPDMRERIAGKVLERVKGSAILLITHDEREARLLGCEETIRLT